MDFEPVRKAEYRKVPALDKCFRLLDLFACSERPLCVSEIARDLNYNKSTVYNLVHTLRDLAVLEEAPEKKFRFGSRIYALGRFSGSGSELISAVRPFMEEICRRTKLSVFLGIRSEDRAVILSKVDSPGEIRVHSEVGMRLPLTAGAGGKALLSHLSDVQLERMLSETALKRFTSASCTDPQKWQESIVSVRREGFAFDDEEYISGIRALAVPLRLRRESLQAALWVVGLRDQITDGDLPSFKDILKRVAARIEIQFSMSG